MAVVPSHLILNGLPVPTPPAPAPAVTDARADAWADQLAQVALTVKPRVTLSTAADLKLTEGHDPYSMPWRVLWAMSADMLQAMWRRAKDASTDPALPIPLQRKARNLAGRCATQLVNRGWTREGTIWKEVAA